MDHAAAKVKRELCERVRNRRERAGCLSLLFVFAEARFVLQKLDSDLHANGRAQAATSFLDQDLVPNFTPLRRSV